MEREMVVEWERGRRGGGRDDALKVVVLCVARIWRRGLVT